MEVVIGFIVGLRCVKICYVVLFYDIVVFNDVVYDGVLVYCVFVNRERVNGRYVIYYFG